MRDLAGKVAVVTGAGSGIGLALCERFAAEGMKVVLADLDPASLERAEAELRSRGGVETLAVVADVSKAPSVEALARDALQAFGAVHVVCNNAGVASPPAPSWQKEVEEWELVLGVNLWGVIHGIRTFVPILLQQAEGHIVNTASAAGLAWSPHLADYFASKHAVVSISESLSLELTLLGAPVKVSVLCPGFVRTGILDAVDRRFPRGGSGREGRALHAELRKLMLETGMAPADVAEHVVRAVREDRFYVLPHPDVKPGIRARLEAILAERNPEPYPAESGALPPWTVREARADESAAIARVIREAFEEQRGRIDPPSGAHEETEETVRATLEKELAIVALDGEAIVGCVLCARQEDCAYFHRLAVLPRARRRGLGGALISYVEARAREWCRDRVRLGVRLALPGQRAYYERLGYRFHADGFHPGRAEPTFAFLEKTLA